MKGRNGGDGGGGAVSGVSKGLTSLNRPRQGGGNSCGSVSHAASHPQTEGRDELERERDSGRKTARGLAGETAEMNTKKQKGKKSTAHNGDREQGPQSIKGC